MNNRSDDDYWADISIIGSPYEEQVNSEGKHRYRRRAGPPRVGSRKPFDMEDFRVEEWTYGYPPKEG